MAARRIRNRLPLALPLALAACAQGTALPDARLADAPATDLATTDAPPPSPDAASPDAAPSLDTSPALDAPAPLDRPAPPDAPSPTDGGCDPRMPPEWPAAFDLYPYNPVLVPNPSVLVQGSDNVYAPEIDFDGTFYRMWFGGQGGDGHDRIFFAYSRDGMAFREFPSGAAPEPALDRGTSNHVNDPSVARVGGTYRMYYTDAAVDIDDRIWLAESTDGAHFHKVAMVLDRGAPGSWESSKVGRPSVLFDGTTYRMWYDGSDGTSRHVGLATSTDGVRFVRHPANPLFRNAGAVDVRRLPSGVYVMLREAGDGTYWATSPDGVCWVDRGRLFGLSGQPYDRFGQVTPHLLVAGGAVRGVYFGGASVATWDRNRIAVALARGAPSVGGGCTACTAAGRTCAEACQSAGVGHAGTCAAPGSTNPGACCACMADGCEACTAGAVDCDRACQGAGRPGGFCANPGSTDGARCCACL